MEKLRYICARESYIDKEGTEKVKFNRLGTIFVAKNGKEYAKLYAIPNELLSVFPYEKKEDRQPRSDTMNHSSDKFPPDDVETVDLSKPDEM